MVACYVDGELAEDLSGFGVDDCHVEVVDEEFDVGSGVGSSDADLAKFAGNSEGKVIAAIHAAGISINGIARTLNSDNVPTAKGGAQWYASAVNAVLTSQTLDRLNALAT